MIHGRSAASQLTSNLDVDVLNLNKLLVSATAVAQLVLNQLDESTAYLPSDDICQEKGLCQ